MEKVNSRDPYHAMGRPVRSRLLRFGVAGLSVAVAWALRHALTPLIGPTELPFITFFLAIVVAAGFGGLRPALIAIFLAIVLARWSFFVPIHELSIGSGNVLAGLLMFLFISVLIAGSIEKIHQEKDLLSTTLRSIGDAVIVTDGESRVRFLNMEAENLTGWRMSEARGKPLLEVFKIVNEHTRKPLGNPALEALHLKRTVILSGHTLLLTKDGREMPVDDSVAPIRDVSGRMAGTVIVFRDITEKRNAERTSARLASIVENSEDAIIAKDLHGIVTNWNKAAERIFGYTAEEITGKSVRVLIPEDRQAEEDQLLKALGRGERLEKLETVRRTKDGREIDVLSSSSPIKDAEGNVIGASTIAHDISREKTMEAELTMAHAELEEYARKLEETVAERTAHLQATIAELEGVSYSLSHDMRAPLRTVQSFSQIVLVEAGDKLGATEKNLLEKIISAAARLDRLIQDVLTYSRVSREKIELKTLDVEKLIKQIVDERPDLQMPKAEVDIQGPLPTVRGHEAYLSQCITNLLDNAVKFVPRDRHPEVCVRSEVHNGHVKLWFEDNGIGIPQESQQRIFGLFERLHAQTDYPGTGIGLTIVRKAVERMGGKIGVESEPDHGSRFWLQLKKGEKK
jgi:PAS domain S-box-containing protein